MQQSGSSAYTCGASKVLPRAASSGGNKLNKFLNIALEAYEAGDVARIKEKVQNRQLPDFTA